MADQYQAVDTGSDGKELLTFTSKFSAGIDAWLFLPSFFGWLSIPLYRQIQDIQAAKLCMMKILNGNCLGTLTH